MSEHVASASPAQEYDEQGRRVYRCGTLVYSQSMGLDLNLIGKSSAISGVAIVACLSFAGLLADRWNPVRVDAYYNALVFCLLFANLIWLFIDPPETLVYYWVSIAGIPFSVLLLAISGTAYRPRLMQLFPKDRFGVFCGAQALVRSAGTMIGGLVAGVYLDVVKRFYPEGSLQPYRYITLWQFVWGLATFFFCYRVYRYWKRLGGEQGFEAPLTQVRLADLPKAKETKLLRGMLLILAISWCGTLLTFGFYCFYFLAVEPMPSSATACGIVTVLVLLSLPALIGLLKFMERP